MVELQLAREGVEAEVKGLSLARHTAESEGAAARGRAAGLEAACEAQASQIEMLTAHLTAARHRRVPPPRNAFKPYNCCYHCMQFQRRDSTPES